MRRQRPAWRTGLAAGLAALCLLQAAPAAAQEEVPFVTTPDNVTAAMLELAGVGPGDRLIDLGSGDGRIVIVAAARHGASGFGVEIVPELVERSRRSAQQAGVADRARFAVQDLFATPLDDATVVTMYLLPDVNLQLRPALLRLKPGTRVVSHDWHMGDWVPDRTLTLPVPEKKLGLDKSSRVHLWVVPARVAGLWCGRGLWQGATLQLDQRFQRFGAVFQRPNSGAARVTDGRVDGSRLQPQAELPPLRLDADGRTLRRDDGDGDAHFVRAEAERCR